MNVSCRASFGGLTPVLEEQNPLMEVPTIPLTEGQANIREELIMVRREREDKLAKGIVNGDRLRGGSLS